MRNFFNLESPIMIFFSNLTDVIILNILCLVCSIPIVTIGPSVTALHYVTLKMVKDEEVYVLKYFFKSFKENLKQSIIAWVIFLVITITFLLDYRIIKSVGMEENKILFSIIGAIYLLICLFTMYIFPLLARFENTLIQTVKNAVFMSILHIFRTVIMAVIYVVPAFLISKHYNFIMVYLLVGIAGPAYINSFFWRSIFKKYEPQEIKEEITADEDFHVIVEET